MRTKASIKESLIMCGHQIQLRTHQGVTNGKSKTLRENESCIFSGSPRRAKPCKRNLDSKGIVEEKVEI